MNFDKIVVSRQLKNFCQRHHIRHLSFFGSVVCDDFSPESDIDVLVEFEPGFIPGFDFFTIETELSILLGHKVDLQTLNFSSPEIRRSVLSEAVPAYEQARQSASRFFTSLRVETDKGDGSSFAQAQRKGMQPLYEQRDEIITLLARGDLVSADQLSGSYASYHDHEQVRWCS